MTFLTDWIFTVFQQRSWSGILKKIIVFVRLCFLSNKTFGSDLLTWHERLIYDLVYEKKSSNKIWRLKLTF